MSLFSVFFIGVGLAMDACAVSFAKGMCLKKTVFRYAWILAFAFGLFQAGMPLLGWWIGHYFEGFITAVDHWIAFILLGTIGFHMIKEAKDTTDESECPATAIPLKDIIILAVATSIDALAVGISFTGGYLVCRRYYRHHHFYYQLCRCHHRQSLRRPYGYLCRSNRRYNINCYRS